jgi:hypothetical protein
MPTDYPAHRDEPDPALLGLATYIAFEVLDDEIADGDADQEEEDDEDW